MDFAKFFAGAYAIDLRHHYIHEDHRWQLFGAVR
jgi:hypothetical protein